MYAMIMFCNFHDLHVDEYGNRQEPYGCLLIIYDLRVTLHAM